MISRQRRLSRRLERSRRFAERHPVLYRARLLAWAGLGYAWLVAAVGLPLAAAAFFGHAAHDAFSTPTSERHGMTLALAVFSASGLAAVLLALWSSLRQPPPAPSGVILRRDDAPALFDAVERLRAHLHVGPIRRILLTEEFNAAVAIVPRFAGLGGSRTYLLVGLPLMQALSPEQFNAVVAHELGHVSGGLNRLMQWMYAWNLKWEYLARSSGHAGPIQRTLLAPFARWYSRRLTLAAHPLLSGIELEADRLARSAVGRAQYAESILAVELRQMLMEQQFSASTQAAMAREPRPPEDNYARLRSFFAAPVDGSVAAACVHMVLAREPDARDTHPTPRRRLEELGALAPGPVADVLALVPGQARMAASEFVLGAAEDELTRLLGATWKQRMAAGWLAEYRDAVLRESELHDLRRRDARGRLDADGLWRMARLAEEFAGRREAFGLFLRCLEHDRDEPKANFAFGRILLEEGEESGVPYVEFAMESDPFLAVEGCALICRWLCRTGRERDAEPWAQRAAREARRLRDAVEERQCLAADSPLLAHGLDRLHVARLLSKLGEIEDLDDAWIARLAVEHFPEKPTFLLVVRMAPGLVLDADEADRLRDWLDFEDHLVVFAPRRIWERMLAGRVRSTAGAHVFSRKGVAAVLDESGS